MHEFGPGILMLALMAVLAAIVYKSTRETGEDGAAVNAAGIFSGNSNRV